MATKVNLSDLYSDAAPNWAAELRAPAENIRKREEKIDNEAAKLTAFAKAAIADIRAQGVEVSSADEQAAIRDTVATGEFNFTPGAKAAPVVPAKKADFSDRSAKVDSTEQLVTTDSPFTKDVNSLERNLAEGGAIVDATQAGLQTSGAAMIERGAESSNPLFKFLAQLPGAANELAMGDLPALVQRNLGKVASQDDAKKLRAAAKANTDATVPFRKSLEGRDVIMRELAEGTLDIAASPASFASLLGGPVGMVAVADAYNQAYAGAKAAGMEGIELEAYAMTQAAPELISLIPAGKLLERIPYLKRTIFAPSKKAAARAVAGLAERITNPAAKAAVTAVKTALGEGTGEVFTGTLQDVASSTFELASPSEAGRKYGTTQSPGDVSGALEDVLSGNVEDAVAKGKEIASEFGSRRYREFRAGAMMGGAFSTATIPGEIKDYNRQVEQQANETAALAARTGLEARLTARTREQAVDDQATKGIFDANEEARIDAEKKAADAEKQKAFDQAEKDAAEAKRLEVEAGFRTIERDSNLPTSRVEEYAGVKERVPVNPAAEITPEQVAEQDAQTATEEADRLDRVELGGITEELRREQQAQQKKADKKAKEEETKRKAAETKRRREVSRQVLAENPGKDIADLAPIVRERLAATPVAASEAVSEIVTPEMKAALKAKGVPAATVEKMSHASAVKRLGKDAPVAKAIAPKATPTPAPTKPDANVELDDIAKTLGLEMSGPANVSSDAATDAEYVAKVRDVVKSLAARQDRKSVDVQNLMRQGKLIVATNPESVGRKAPGSAAEYVPGEGKMYLYTDGMDAKDATAAAVRALHESTHAGQFNNREGRPDIYTHMMSQAGNNSASNTIRAAAAKGNKLAIAAVDKAKAASPDTKIQDLELVPYFVGEAVESRATTFGQLGGVVKDIKSKARDFARKAGLNLDLSLDDINSAAQNVAGEIVDTDLAPTDGPDVSMIAGQLGTGFENARARGVSYKGYIDNQYRYAFSDVDARLKESEVDRLRNGATLSLDLVLDHPELYKQYPTIGKDVKLAVDDSKARGFGAGLYVHGTNTIYIGTDSLNRLNDPEIRNTILHEVQHAIQRKEGFISGENYSYLEDPAISDDFDRANENLDKAISRFELGQWKRTTDPTITAPVLEEAKANGWGLAKTTEEVLKRGLEKRSTDRAVAGFGTNVYTPARNKQNMAARALTAERARAMNLYMRNYGETEARTTELLSNASQEDLDAGFYAGNTPEAMMKVAKGNVDVADTLDTAGYGRGRRPATSSAKPSATKQVTLKDGTKVELRLEETTPGDDTSVNITAHDTDGNELGFAQMFTVEDDGLRYNPSVEINADLRRKGLATAMYNFGADNGAKIPKLNQKGQVRTFEGQAFRESPAMAGLAMAQPKASAPKTAAFDKWFGDSQATNEDGSPKVYYTGTSKDVDFKSFKVPKNGAWFSSNPKTASDYAKDNDSMKKVRDEEAKSPWAMKDVNTASRVFNVYIKAENPYTITKADYDEMNVNNYKAAQGRLFDRLRAQGYDSVFMDDQKDIIVVLNSPTQIKSVFNSGNFDGKKPDTLAMAQPAATTKPAVHKAPLWLTGMFRADKGLPRDINEILEHAMSSPAGARMISEATMGRYSRQLPKEAAKRRMSAEELNTQIGRELDEAVKDTVGYTANKAAFDSVAKTYGPAGEALMRMRDQVDDLTMEILRQRSASGIPLSAKEKKLYSTMFNNMGRYTHRQYAANAGKAGQAYADTVWKDFEKYKKGHARTNPVVAANYQTVANAVTALVDNSLTIPEDFSNVSEDKLHKLYATWGTVGPEGAITRDEKIAELLAARTRINGDTDRLNRVGEEIAKELIGLAPATQPITTYYRGAKQDTGILKERENVPPAIRQLMGEITDPSMRLLLTVAKQAEFVGRNKMLLELAQSGSNELQPPGTVGTGGTEGWIELTGEGYGPLEGWRASKNMHAAIGDVQQSLATFEQAVAMSANAPKELANKILLSASDAWSKLAGASKVAQITLNPFNFVFNFLGGPMMMLTNGNVNPVNFAKGVKGSIDLIAYAMNQHTASDAAVELTSNGVVDSAFIGEIKGEQYRELRKLIGKMSGHSDHPFDAWAKDFGSATKSGWIETYAMMDVMFKIANYYQQKDVLTGYYKANGDSKTDAQIQREAAEIASRTNFTFKRVAPLLKAIEQKGFSAFGPYMHEVVRTQVTNVLQGFGELQRANQAKTPAARNAMLLQGSKRLTGQATAWALTGVAAAGLADAVFGTDDEEERRKRALLPDYQKDQDFVQVGTDSDGKPVYMQFSRLDPVGPITDIMRSVIVNGNVDLEAMAERLVDFYVLPRLGPQVAKAVSTMVDPTTKINRDPLVKQLSRSDKARVGTDVYSDLMDTGVRIGIPARVTKAWTNVAEAMAPGIFGSWRDENPRVTTDSMEGAGINALSYMGLRLAKMDPKTSMKFASMDYQGALKVGRTELKNLFDQNPDRTAEDVITLMASARQAEKEAFDKTRLIYEGALAIGMKPEDATQMLADTRLPGKVVKQVVTNQFKSEIIRKESLKYYETADKKAAKTDAEKAEVKKKYADMWEVLEQVNEGSK